MKKTIILIASAFMAFTSVLPSANVLAQPRMADRPVHWIEVVAVRGWNGDFCSGGDGVCQAEEVIFHFSRPTNTDILIADGLVSLDELTLTFTSQVPQVTASNPGVFKKDIILPEKLANAFGYNSMTILAGSYKFDFSKNKNGTVTVKIKGTKTETSSKPTLTYDLKAAKK